MEIIDDKCSCGEEISVQINCKQRVCRTDGKRPFYKDAKLPDGVDPTMYSVDSITVFRCRNCNQPVDETVAAASFD